LNKQILSLTLSVVLGVLLPFTALRADLKPGDKLPDPTLKNQALQEVSLHDLLKKVTVIHLWKGD